ncbi:Tyrosine kinase [Entamoeba marina]
MSDWDSNTTLYNNQVEYCHSLGTDVEVIDDDNSVYSVFNGTYDIYFFSDFIQNTTFDTQTSISRIDIRLVVYHIPEDLIVLEVENLPGTDEVYLNVMTWDQQLTDVSYINRRLIQFEDSHINYVIEKVSVWGANEQGQTHFLSLKQTTPVFTNITLSSDDITLNYWNYDYYPRCVYFVSAMSNVTTNVTKLPLNTTEEKVDCKLFERRFVCYNSSISTTESFCNPFDGNSDAFDKGNYDFQLVHDYINVSEYPYYLERDINVINFNSFVDDVIINSQSYIFNASLINNAINFECSGDGYYYVDELSDSWRDISITSNAIVTISNISNNIVNDISKSVSSSSTLEIDNYSHTSSTSATYFSSTTPIIISITILGQSFGPVDLNNGVITMDDLFRFNGSLSGTTFIFDGSRTTNVLPLITFTEQTTHTIDIGQVTIETETCVDLASGVIGSTLTLSNNPLSGLYILSNNRLLRYCKTTLDSNVICPMNGTVYHTSFKDTSSFIFPHCPCDGPSCTVRTLDNASSVNLSSSYLNLVLEVTTTTLTITDATYIYSLSTYNQLSSTVTLENIVEVSEISDDIHVIVSNGTTTITSSHIASLELLSNVILTAETVVVDSLTTNTLLQLSESVNNATLSSTNPSISLDIAESSNLLTLNLIGVTGFVEIISKRPMNIDLGGADAIIYYTGIVNINVSLSNAGTVIFVGENGVNIDIGDNSEINSIHYVLDSLCQVAIRTTEEIVCKLCDYKLSESSDGGGCTQSVIIPNCQFRWSSNCVVCDDGYYVNNTYGCTLCDDSNCIRCNQTESIQCKQNYILENGECIENNISNCLFVDNNKCMECTQSYYMNENMNCIACDESCYHCALDTENTIPEESVCVVCDNLLVSGSQCISVENAQNVSTTRIVACNDGYYLYEGSCNACSDLYGLCAKCTIERCENCEDNAVFGYDGKCVTSDGCSTFIDGMCQSCSDPDKINNMTHCVDPNIDRCKFYDPLLNCLECADGYSAYLGDCVETIPNCEYYSSIGCSRCKESYFLDEDQNCSPCTGGCLDYSKCATCDGWHRPTEYGNACESYVPGWFIALVVIVSVISFAIVIAIVMLVIQRIQHYIHKKKLAEQLGLIKIKKSLLTFIDKGEVAVDKDIITFGSENNEIPVLEKSTERMYVGNISTTQINIVFSRNSGDSESQNKGDQEKYKLDISPSSVVLKPGIACAFEFRITPQCTCTIDDELKINATIIRFNKNVTINIPLKVTTQRSTRLNYGDIIIEKKLGEGGFGIVYKGTFETHKVAIKKMKTVGDCPDNMEEFEREVSMLDKSNPSQQLLHSYNHKGTIYRIKMEKFLSYDSCEIFPGPGLNVILGPNGSGKSTIACAIALALGAPPKILGKPNDLKLFVKDQKGQATIEIELHVSETENITIKREFNSDNVTNWWINGKRSNHKSVLAKCKEYSIMVDNLCQFLPQERVSKFADLNPQELLRETERATGTVDLVEKHEKIIEEQNSCDDHKTKFIDKKTEVDKAQSEVAKLEKYVKEKRENEKNQTRLKNLQLKRPWAIFEESRKKAQELQKQKKELEAQLSDCLAEKQPIEIKYHELQNKMKKYDKLVSDRRNKWKANEKEIDESIKKKNALDEKIREMKKEKEMTAKRMEVKTKKIDALNNEIIEIQNKINELPDLNIQSAEVEIAKDKSREISSNITIFTKRKLDADAQTRALSGSKLEYQKNLRKIDDIRELRLRNAFSGDPHIHTAYKWLEEHRNEFEDKVYGPISVELDVKEQKYSDMVETAIPTPVLKGFVVTNKRDYNFFIDNVFYQKKCNVRCFCTSDGKSSSQSTQKRIRSDLGVICPLSDLVSGPTPVLETVESFGNLSSKMACREDVSKNIYSLPPGTYCTQTTTIQVVKSRYSDVVSTKTVPNRKSKFLRIAIDAKMREELIEKIEDTEKEIQSKKELIENCENQIKVYEQQKRQHEAIIEQYEKSKNLLKEYNRMITTKKKEIITWDSEVDNEKKIEDLKKKIKSSETKVLGVVMGIGEKRLDDIRSKLSMNVYMVTANVKAAERKKLQQMLDEIKRKESQIEERLNSIEDRYADAKTDAVEKRREAEEVVKLETMQEIFATLPNDLDEINEQIETEKFKLERRGSFEDNIEEVYEEKKQKLGELMIEKQKLQERLDQAEETLTTVKESWLTDLKDVIRHIHFTFKEYMRQTGCEGSVELVDSDRYDKYGIEIRVKFNDSANLQIFNGRTQSGGEKSVSTMLYLLSLQELTFCPFRLVDEINQGMDPYNERMIFNQIVKAVGREKSQQYFLVTPKLLSDLPYGTNVKVLCIMKGCVDTVKPNFKDVIEAINI